ncbi:hypothetical protein ACIPPJ_27755 [Streptomyces sp. NPDC086091]|uniref:hypothetical protein n=1 Tax=Streptomyces sp. NPDC086091 TaxID=3365751 RepID=UPI0038117A2C
MTAVDPALSFRAVPGPGFTVGCTVSTWVHSGEWDPPVAFVLVGHPSPRRPGETAASIEAGLMGMVDAMGLRPAAERVPDVGPRLVLRGPRVVLDYGHPRYVLCLPTPGGRWRTHVATGGTVCLTVGLDPVPSGARPDAVEAYLRRVVTDGRAYVGATALRTR